MAYGRTSARTDTRVAAQTPTNKTYQWKENGKFSTTVQDFGRVWNGGGGSDGKANGQVGQYYGYAQRDGQQTAMAWNDYWRAGSDVYGKRTTRTAQLEADNGMGKVQYKDRKALTIQQNEGKGELTDPPQPLTAEQTIALQKMKNRFKGRISLPSSGSGGADSGVSINVTPGTTGLNF